MYKDCLLKANEKLNQLLAHPHRHCRFLPSDVRFPPNRSWDSDDARLGGLPHDTLHATANSDRRSLLFQTLGWDDNGKTYAKEADDNVAWGGAWETWGGQGGDGGGRGGAGAGGGAGAAHVLSDSQDPELQAALQASLQSVYR